MSASFFLGRTGPPPFPPLCAGTRVPSVPFPRPVPGNPPVSTSIPGSYSVVDLPWRRHKQLRELCYWRSSGNCMFFGGGDDDRWWCRLWMYFGYCCSVGPRPQVIPLVGPQHRLPLPRHRHYLLVDPVQKLVHRAGHRSNRNAQMNPMRVV